MQNELQRSKNVEGAFSQSTCLEVGKVKNLYSELVSIAIHIIPHFIGERTRQGRNRSVVDSLSLKENKIKIRRRIKNEFLKFIFSKNFSFEFNTKFIQHNLHTTVVFLFKSRSIQVMVIFGYFIISQRRE